ncbi:MFS transporter, partial [Actinomadura kijaniata]|uniref:MFS transporter n=1 Tax=Actinomadura kijaniata TaxID=46161 RepID=UPI003F1D8C15
MNGRDARRGVPALGLGVFAVGTDEFVLAGILPELSRAFAVSIGAAGQVVTVFALACAVLAPVLGALTAGWPRRRVLLAALGVHLAGNVATALAPSFALVLAGQVVAAAGAGLFVPAASVTAAALVPADRRGRAIATVTTGFAAATAFGAPLGTALGDALGWRATVWFLVGLTLFGAAGVLALVPGRVAAAPAGPGGRLAPLRDRRALALLATTLAGFTAIYVPYTYIAAVFAPATGGDGDRLAVLLLVFGVAGTLANHAAGTLADRLGGRAVVTGALALLVVALLLLPLARGSYGLALPMTVGYALTAYAVTTPQQTRLIALDPAAAPVLVSLNAAVLYLAISLSGVLGAAGIAWTGARLLGPLAAVVAVAAVALSEVAHRLAARSPAAGRPSPRRPAPRPPG